MAVDEGFEAAQLHRRDSHLPQGFVSAQPPIRGAGLTMKVLLDDGKVGILTAANVTMVYREAQLSDRDLRRGTICAAPLLDSAEQWIRLDGQYMITVPTEDDSEKEKP